MLYLMDYLYFSYLEVAFSYISIWHVITDTSASIQFKFDSYSPQDDDFEGYDYRLSCRLSAVRLVFLYRFVKEVCWAKHLSLLIF